jgi:hypothetical protein
LVSCLRSRLPPITTLDARDAKAPPVFEVEAPKEAPNVAIIMFDYIGFGGPSSFGGVIETRGRAGLRFSRCCRATKDGKRCSCTTKMG